MASEFEVLFLAEYTSLPTLAECESVRNTPRRDMAVRTVLDDLSLMQVAGGHQWMSRKRYRSLIRRLLKEGTLPA